MDDAQSQGFRHALDHVWSWFNLHATQRLQAVQFFILATAFLATGYVTAFNYRLHAVALVIAGLGLLISYIFYRVERRIRYLLKAAEAALGPLQQRLAKDLSIPELELCARVDVATPGTWPYSKVFRYLYLGTGTAFAVGVANALYALAMSQASPPTFTGLFIALAAGAISSFTGIELLTQGTNTSAGNLGAKWLMPALGAIAIIIGIAIFVFAAFVLVPAYGAPSASA